MNIARFGVDTRFRGAFDSEGSRWNDRLYATIEEDGKAGERTATGETFFDLYCDYRNGPAMHFWQRQGYVDVGTSVRNYKYRHMLRWPW